MTEIFNFQSIDCFSRAGNEQSKQTLDNYFCFNFTRKLVTYFCEKLTNFKDILTIIC